MTLTFTVSSDAETGSACPVELTADVDDITDRVPNPVEVTFVNGEVTVQDFQYGDLDGNQKVNTTDVILLRRHLAGGYQVSIQNGSIIIPNIIESVALSGTVTVPVKNLADSSSVTGNGIQAAVTWSPALAGGRFAQNTVYTATITVSPAPGASFADTVTFSPFDGFTAFKKGSDGSYSATKTFPRTSDKDAPTAEVPTGLTAVFGDTLGSVTLTNPAGNTAGSWSWKEKPDALVGPAGVQSHIAVFTPEDSANYAVVEKPVSITVAKRPVAAPTVSETPIPYDGQEKTIPWQSAPDPQYVETDYQTTGTNAGEYQATTRLKDKNNTEWAGE